jgi:hypothetical protein
MRAYFAWWHKQPQGLTQLCDDDAATQKWGHGRREVRRCFCLATTPRESLRKLALNLLRQDIKARCGLKGRRKAAGWDNDNLPRILAGP